jgi:folate-dependent phosphoribosylglycinamide formyltransferase PurN
MASFCDLAAIVVIREPGSTLKRRVRREMKRVGLFRFLDVLAFRIYYRLFLAKADHAWHEALQAKLAQQYPEVPSSCRVVETPGPNSDAIVRLLEELQPDFMIARCKNILKERVFQTPRVGTFVMHPGICPEYRNAHGCFWALAEDDPGNVGMTLLRVDPGIDTGPVYGYFRCVPDELRESHIVIQSRVVFENLDEIRAKFEEILRGEATPIDTTGRRSRAWGQPWLTRYLRWKRAARKRSRA